ncbi:MAG: ABC transporter permease, partial [Chitinophagia bacterium]|nr:ABC transporter permease [Chitinophagia bacterium]
MAKYSNFRAMRALIRASLQAILKSPSSVIFTIAFPLIFILVFGFLGNNGGFTIRVAAAPGNDTTNFLYTVLHKVDVLRWTPAPDTATANKLIREDDVVAVMDISEQPAGTLPRYKVRLTSPSTETIKAKQLQSIINGVVAAMDPEIAKRQKQMADVQLDITSVREYKNIDFILPGQLSFSLLATGVFGTAFVFFNLRQTLVLKRFFATPVRRHTIV